MCRNVGYDGRQVLGSVLLCLYLFVHVEHRQIVIHHHQRLDVLVRDTLLLTIVFPPLGYVGCEIAKRDD